MNFPRLQKLAKTFVQCRNVFTIKDYRFYSYAKSSEKLTFLTYVNILFGKKPDFSEKFRVHTKWWFLNKRPGSTEITLLREAWRYLLCRYFSMKILLKIVFLNSPKFIWFAFTEIYISLDHMRENAGCSNINHTIKLFSSSKFY